jgi:hypothetical protein
MANAQFLMILVGSEHLEHNFLLFCFQWFRGCWVPRGTRLFLWKINTNFKIKSTAKLECHQNLIFNSLLNALLNWVKQVYCQYTTDRLPVAGLRHTGHPGGVRQHRAGHPLIILLIAHSWKRQTHASSCSMHHHPSMTIMSHARNPRFFACVCCFGNLIRSVIVK